MSYEPKELERLEKAATPGQWSYRALAPIFRYAIKNSGHWDDVDDPGTYPDAEDSVLIADARNALLDMIADLIAARELLREVEWVGGASNPSRAAYCQVCNRYRWIGHAPDCRLKACLERQG